VQPVSLILNTLLEYWRLLICPGTGVSYSLAPDFQHTIIFNKWPIRDGERPQDKVNTTVAYDKKSGKLLKHGFGLDPYMDQKEITVQEWFWHVMNEENKESTSEQMQTFCTDFLSCLYNYLSVLFEKILPQWNQRAVDFVFSTPQSYTSTDSRQDMESLIKAAGFGASLYHRISMISTEQAILTGVSLPGEADTVLIYNAGGTAACISICTISSDAAEPIIKVIDSSTNIYAGSINMDVYAGRVMKESLFPFRCDIDDSILFEDDLLLYGQEFVKRYRENWEAFKHCYTPGAVTGPDFVFSLPDVELRMTSAEVQAIFDSESQEMVSYIEQHVYHISVEHDLLVNCIVLSGGLGASPYIQWKIQNHFAGEIEVLVDAEAGTAASRGLVVARLQELGIVHKGEQEIRRSRE
jgi:hypothetical protein